MGRPETRLADDAETITEDRPMPAKTEKQRRFMGAELQRKREGKKTRTDMSEKELEKFASKPTKDKKD
jgi:hypothetical protein